MVDDPARDRLLAYLADNFKIVSGSNVARMRDGSLLVPVTVVEAAGKGHTPPCYRLDAALAADVDPYRAAAAAEAGVPYEDVSPEQTRRAKARLYAALHGKPKGLRR